MKKLVILALALAFIVSLGPLDAEAARYGGTFNFMAPYGGDVRSLDPQRTNRVQDYIITMNIHRGLFKWDADKNVPVLDLPESMDKGDDDVTYTFKFRDNIKFHDGSDFTVDDVIWSYKRIMRPKSGEISPGSRWIKNIEGAAAYGKGEAEEISGLKKIDDLTLQITLTSPTDIRYALFDKSIAILPKKAVEELGQDFANNPVGCGPFKFVEWTKGSEVVLEKFEDYYIEGRPYLDKVVYRIMPEGAARDLAFRAKDLDATLVGSTQYPVYKKDKQISENMLEVAEMFTRHVGFHMKNFEPFQNKKVRQAINWAIDTDLIIEKLLKGKAFVPRGFLPTTSPAFDPDGPKYGYDPEKAKQLMKEAGYEDGFEFECFGTTNEAWGTPVLEALIPFLQEINVKIKPVQVEGALLAEHVDAKNDFTAYIWSYESGPDPLSSLSRWRCDTPASAGNSVLYCNPEYDKLLDQAAQTTDEAEQTKLLQQANAIFTDDAPMWFFNYNKAVMAHQPWVHNLQRVAIEMMYQDMTNVWVDENSPRAGE
jgi:peptide/nickel transport system substrate-binding protein